MIYCKYASSSHKYWQATRKLGSWSLCYKIIFSLSYKIVYITINNSKMLKIKSKYFRGIYSFSKFLYLASKYRADKQIEQNERNNSLHSSIAFSLFLHCAWTNQVRNKKSVASFWVASVEWTPCRSRHIWKIRKTSPNNFPHLWRSVVVKRLISLGWLAWHQINGVLSYDHDHKSQRFLAAINKTKTALSCQRTFPCLLQRRCTKLELVQNTRRLPVLRVIAA